MPNDNSTTGSADRDRLAILMRAMGDTMRRRFQTVMERHGLTPPLGMLLRHLGGERCSMGEMAHRLSVDASYVTGLADRLEEMDLIAREPSPGDRRIKRLVLTEAGEALRLEMERELAHRPMFDALTDSDVARLVSIFEILLDQDPLPVDKSDPRP